MRVYNDFVILARDVSVDSQDKMLSIFKIVDKFNFSLDPDNYKKFLEEIKDKTASLPAHFVTSSSWSLDSPTKNDLRAILESKIVDPTGKELGRSRNEMVFIAGSDRVRLNGVIEAVPVTSNGRYKIELSVLDLKTGKILCSGSTSYQVSVDEDDAKEVT